MENQASRRAQAFQHDLAVFARIVSVVSEDVKRFIESLISKATFSKHSADVVAIFTSRG